MEVHAGSWVAPVGPSQTVSYTGTAGTITNPLPMNAQGFWAFCTTTAYISWGASPTATATDFPIPANIPVKIMLPTSGSQVGIKVSAIQFASGGSLLVAPIQY